MEYQPPSSPPCFDADEIFNWLFGVNTNVAQNEPHCSLIDEQALVTSGDCCIGDDTNGHNNVGDAINVTNVSIVDIRDNKQSVNNDDPFDASGCDGFHCNNFNAAYDGNY